ncbi:TOR1A [Branchiostoma lanceolatum]|uniref:TOR1A protein n=1 Tax=Branchiostoma lanceolatum TaxID=7740 RepID=A0A8J9Z6Q8_BRALA|nr:TOR1A [Branchiostoma lanceolatum]
MMGYEKGSPRKELERTMALPIGVVAAVLILSIFIYAVLYSSTPPSEPVTTICDGKFNPNMTYLKTLLTKRLYGQPLVRDVVVKAIHSHLAAPKPDKALVFSFHGPSGVGKTFVADMIAKAVFTDGMRSPHVHYYSAEVDFKHTDDLHIREYKKRLRRDISEGVRRCQYSIFIFDHVDRMPRDLIDTIKPFVEEYVKVDGINFRKAIFILISYSASDAIIKMTMKLRSEEIEREDFSLEGFEEAITKSALGRQAWCPDLKIDWYHDHPVTGYYHKIQTYLHRPVYKHDDKEQYLYFNGTHWVLLFETRNAATLLMYVRDKPMRPEEVRKQWKVVQNDGLAFRDAPEIRLTCSEMPVPSGGNVCVDTRTHACLETVQVQRIVRCGFLWLHSCQKYRSSHVLSIEWLSIMQFAILVAVAYFHC